MLEKIKIIDTHTHPNIEPLIEEFDDIIFKCYEQGIGLNIVGVDLKTSQTAIQQAKKFKFLTCSVAIHPNDLHNIENDFVALEKLIAENIYYISCIGECGLDYYHEQNYDHDFQKHWFKKHIELAKKYHKPLMLHIRNAHDDAIAILKELAVQDVIIHCFTDKKEYAQQYIEMGYYISYPGVITFKPTKNNQLHELYEAIKITPLDKILVETDAPYLTPVPKRGQTNYPYYVLYTSAFIANLLGITHEKMQKILLENSLRILNFKK